MHVRLFFISLYGHGFHHGTRDWQVYKNTEGITTTMRSHLRQRHGTEYDKVVSALKLKHSNELEGDGPTPNTSFRRGPFKLEEWIRLIIRWIVADDQVCF